MLESLEVLNGEMSPKFDSLNETYTVNVSNDISKLELNYKVKDNSLVNIYGNSNFQIGENIVTIEIMNELEEVSIYKLIVTKEEEKIVSSLETNFVPIETPKELPSYVAPLIASICFLLILITFGILFPHKRHKKKSF